MPSTTTSAHQAALRVIPPVDAPAAMSPPWSFEALIAPISPAEFCSICWGRQPLHIQRGLPDFYRGLISLEYVERYLSVEDIFRRPDTIFMRGYDFWSQGAPPANLSEAYERMMRGQPLQLRNLDRVLDPSAPLLAAVRNMELALQHPKESVGGYISRARSAGLGPHHDETEIFTLQIVGRKRWRLFHQVHTDKPGFHDPSALGAPAHEVLLEAGDLLYHPRGWIHDVASEDVPSFSVTIVFRPITWRAVLEGIVEQLGALPPFVDQLPAGVLLHDSARELLRQPFDERLALLRHALSSVSIGDIVDDLAARHVAHLTLPPAHRIDTLFRIDLLTLDSRLERQRDVCAAIRVNADGVTLLLPGGYRMSVPADHEAALRWLLRIEHPFHVRDIEGSLGNDQTLTLVKRLVAAGLLRPA